GHAAHADGEAPGLADVLADVDAFDIVERLGQVGDPLGGKVSAFQHRDAGRRSANQLLEAAGGDSNAIRHTGDTEVQAVFPNRAGGKREHGDLWAKAGGGNLDTV